MKKTILILFTLLLLSSIASISYAADDGYASCVDSIQLKKVNPICFAKNYLPLQTFSTSWCVGATGNMTIFPSGLVTDSNDGAAVGAQCTGGCTADESTLPDASCNPAAGQIILDMGASTPLMVLSGKPDLYVSEGGSLEPFTVAVSNARTGPWTTLGYSCGKTPLVAGYGADTNPVHYYPFDITGVPANTKYQYVRITTTATDANRDCAGNPIGPQHEGADIRWVLAGQVPCSNECNIGDHGCDDSGTQWTCGEVGDSDTCREKIYTDCSAGNSCVAPPGQCTSSCVPQTCQQLGKECGSWSDTCGGTVICGNNGVCAQPGNYCTTTGDCKQLTTDATFTCTGTSGTLTADTDVPATIQLKYYADSLPAQTKSLPKNGPFSFALSTPFADDATHTFRLTAIISDAAGEYELARRDALLCPSTPPTNCALKDLSWNTTCVGSGLPVRLSGNTITACPSATIVNFEVWEKDDGPDDHMRPDPQPDTVQPSQSRFSTEWNASWQDDEYSKDPIYYAKAINTQNTVTTTGTPLTVKPCTRSIDADCDGVPTAIDRCAGTPQCASVDSNGCEHSDQQAICDALWDCSSVEWSACTDGKISRDICNSGDGPTCCTDINYYNNDACKCVFQGNTAQFSLCQQYAPETERSCVIEEAFPIFTWVNALIVSVLLAGYYILRRKY